MTASDSSAAPQEQAPAGGRHAAGEDPLKREQILDGAKRIFMGKGFDAASMNDVVRESGVSKGTIYVYFQNKEDLFAALIERERGKFVNSMRSVLEEGKDLETTLFRFGVTFCRHLTNDDVICSMRSVLGVIDRMPNLAKRFFASEPVNVRIVLRDHLEKQAAAGVVAVEDADLAARQFIELSSGTYFKFRLFGEIKEPPPQAEIEYVIASAVRVFLCAYRPGQPG